MTQENGLPNKDLIQSIARQISKLVNAGTQVILVSSGAVAAGRSIARSLKKLDTVAERQLLSALGQVKLINLYTDYFNEFDQVMCAGTGNQTGFQG